MLPLILISGLLVNWMFLSQLVYAAPLAPTATPGHNTPQQFFQQGQPNKANQSGFHRPTPNAAVLQTDTSVKHNTPVPSVEPAKMHDLTYVLDDSFVLHRPAMQPNSQADKVTGTAIPSGTTPLIAKGDDGRLEIDLPRGSLDFSQAKLADGSTPVGQLFLQIHQISGHTIEEESILGSYQIQILDSQGHVVQGVRLVSPATMVYHYQSWELQDLNIDPTLVHLAWPEQLAAAPSSQATPASTPQATASPTPKTTPASTPQATATPTPQAPATSTPQATGFVLPMANNASAQTLSAQSSTLLGTMSVSAPPSIANPATPDLFEASGNSGQYTYSYPISMAPGPGGFAPKLALSYASQSTNERYSRTAPAGAEGDGWSLSLGSITMATYPSTSTGGAQTWYSINGVDGISDKLLPNPAGQSTTYITQHISGMLIEWTGQHWKVWGKDGTYYELGKTTDSQQKTSAGVYEWDLNKIQAPFNSSGQVNTMFVSYLQDSPDGGTTIRSAGIKQIQYGFATSGAATSLSQVAGTIDLTYLAPTAQSPWSSAYGSSYYNNCHPYKTTSLRCDDPLDDSNGMSASPVRSTLSLQSIKSYVGPDGNSSNLGWSYTFAYQDSSFWVCHDTLTQIETYCAGEHLLTSITPSASVQGSSHTLKPVTFGYTPAVKDTYYDHAQKNLAGTGQYTGQNDWQYLNFYEDLRTGTGANISYGTAYGNMDGTPVAKDGQGDIVDDRFDPLFCFLYTTCTGVYAHPDDDSWSTQVVIEIDALGTDSSGNTTVAATHYAYDLKSIASNSTPVTSCNPVTGSGIPSYEADCMADNWSPGYNGTQTPAHDKDWQDYYHSEYRGFHVVYITSAANNMTVDYYFGIDGWWTPTSNGTNYNSGQLYQEDVYQGSSETPSELLKETLNYYSGVGNTPDGNAYSGFNACNGGLSAIYTPCVEAPLETKTLLFEGNASNAPWVDTKYTYDDLNGSAGYPYSTNYNNETQEVITGSNLPTSIYPLTEKWTYAINNNPSGNHYIVDKVTHSETDDASGHVWNCQDTAYDEGFGGTTPSAGWPTTQTSYSTCGNSSTALKSYTGYDQYGNQVATVDPVGAANPTWLSAGNDGCTMSTPAYLTSAWTTGRYSTCTYWDTGHAAANVTLAQDALAHSTNASYDYTSGNLLTSTTDANGQVTSDSESYDSNGNETISLSQPGESSGSYTTQQSENSHCTTSSTLPCYEIDTTTSLYSSAVSRTFYDQQGRAVESRTPGPTPGDDTVVITLYNDQNNTVWKSVPFQVTAGSGWLDRNGVKDINGNVPGGTTTFLDALGRTIAVQDPNYGSTQEPGLACSATLSGTYTACTNYSNGQAVGDSAVYDMTTAVDPNGHVTQSFADVLGNTRSTQTYQGTYQGANAGTFAQFFTGNNDGTWNTALNQTVTVNLKAGANSIQFFNPTGWAPNFISITVGGTTYQASASGNTVAGGAQIWGCCSGQMEAGNVGMGGSIQFNNITVASAGSYAMTVNYVDGDSGRTALLGVNGELLNKQTQTQYNALGKPTSVTVTDEAPQSGQTVTSVTTTATYDDLGRQISVTDPDQGTFTYSYDPDGRVLSVTQTSGSNSRVVGYNYDILGRPGCEQTAAPTPNWYGGCSAGNPLLVNTYDTTKLGTQGTTDFPVGRLTQSVATTYYPDSSSATVTQQYQTDQRGRATNTQMQLGLPSSWNVSVGLPSYQLAVSYNDANQVTTTSATSGSASYSFTNVYDGTNGSLQGLSSGSIATSNLASLAYNEYAQLSGLTLLNGSSTQIASEQYSYDGNLRPTSLTANWLPGSGTSGEILGSARTYDNGGNVTSTNTFFAQVPGQSASGGSETQNFCYDELNRLVWAGNGGTQPGAGNGTCGSGTLSSGLVGGGYTSPTSYTNLGQLWQGPVNGQGATEQYLYCNSAPHQLTGIYPIGTTCANKGSATAIYSAGYDPWGNETSRTYNSITATLSYDTLNRMTEYNAGVNSQEFYVYDASGNRVLKRSISGGSTSLTAYAFGLQELSYTGSGASSSQTDYYAIAGHLIGSTNGSAITYDLTDAEGSVLTSLSSSAVLGEQIFGPYGNQRYTQGTMGTDKGYTGQFQDAATGLDYYNARYYDPVMGQFLSADNVQGNTQGMDPYSYVNGNPETATDPTGNRECILEDDGQQVCGGDVYTPPASTGCGPCMAPPGFKPQPPANPCAAGPQPGSGCKYSSGECKGHTYNQCNSWKADARTARDTALANLKTQYTWEGIVAGIAGIILGVIQFQKEKGLLAKLMSALTIINSLAGILVLFAQVLSGSAYQLLTDAVLALQTGAGLIRSAIGLIKGLGGAAQVWIDIADMTGEEAINAVGGPLGILSSIAVGFVVAGFGQFLNAGVSFLQAKATWDLANYQAQENMPIQAWCMQNRGCPSISSYTGA